MIEDIWTVTRKDLHEYAASLYTGPWCVLVLLLLVSLVAAFTSLQSDGRWLFQPATLFVLIWLPSLLVASMVADSFAGERERHTLEPLLATRLSNRAILLGKIAAATLYGWGILLLCLVIAALAAALTGTASLSVSPLPALRIAGFSLLVAALAAAMGALVSIPAATARQAQQFVIVGMLVLISPLVLAPAAIQHVLTSARISALGAAAVLVLLAVDATLVTIASSLLKRNRLSPH